VGDHGDRHAGLRDDTTQVEGERRLSLRVEVVEGLVEQQHRGLEHERSRQRQAP
jgi:hypothetical protein